MPALELRLIGVLLPPGLRDALLSEASDPDRDGVVGLNYMASSLRGVAAFVAALAQLVCLVFDNWSTPVDDIAIVVVIACALGVFWCLARILLVKRTTHWAWAVPRDMDAVWQVLVASGVYFALWL